MLSHGHLARYFLFPPPPSPRCLLRTCPRRDHSLLLVTEAAFPVSTAGPTRTPQHHLSGARLARAGVARLTGMPRPCTAKSPQHRTQRHRWPVPRPPPSFSPSKTTPATQILVRPSQAIPGATRLRAFNLPNLRIKRSANPATTRDSLSLSRSPTLWTRTTLLLVATFPGLLPPLLSVPHFSRRPHGLRRPCGVHLLILSFPPAAPTRRRAPRLLFPASPRSLPSLVLNSMGRSPRKISLGW